MNKIFKHQIWHFILLGIFLFGLNSFINATPEILFGQLWGIETSVWLVLALLSPIIHQIYVLLCWRYELHFKSITSSFGNKGFKLYKIGFAALIISRPITITLLAISNNNTLHLNNCLSYVILIVLMVPAIYLFYSLRKYFGIDRAFGIDHFYPEKYRNAPMVKQGIFKYTSNAMYVFGFFILWVPGVLFESKAALFMALFNHCYIWVHYYFTELPDMKIIYSENG